MTSCIGEAVPTRKKAQSSLPAETAPATSPARSSEISVNLASANQCLGWGVLTPLRLAVAYGSETRSAAASTGTWISRNRGRISRNVAWSSHAGCLEGSHRRIDSRCRNCVSDRRASATGVCVAIRPLRAANL